MHAATRERCEQYDHAFSRDNFKTIDTANNASYLHIIGAHRVWSEKLPLNDSTCSTSVDLK